MHNTNCLQGIRCPQCKQRDRVKVIALSRFTLLDNGTDDYEDVEWDENSHMECPDCGYAGTARDFMAKKPKIARRYYVGSLYERNGEYEYTSDFRFSLPPRFKPETFLKNTASSWYSGDMRRDGEGCYYNGGEVWVEPGTYREINEATFKALDGFLTDMSGR